MSCLIFFFFHVLFRAGVSFYSRKSFRYQSVLMPYLVRVVPVLIYKTLRLHTEIMLKHQPSITDILYNSGSNINI